MDLHAVKTIKRNIEKSLEQYKIRYESMLENNAKCISIVNYTDGNDDEHLYLWIRLLPMNDEKYVVDISNIIIPKSKRNKHVFSTLYSRLSKCKYVGRIQITSVCTTEMDIWCKKHKLILFNYNSYYQDFVKN